MLGIETKVRVGFVNIYRNCIPHASLCEGDSEMDRCHRHPEESWSASRDCQGLDKVKIGSKLLWQKLAHLPHTGLSPGCSQCTMESAMTWSDSWPIWECGNSSRKTAIIRFGQSYAVVTHNCEWPKFGHGMLKDTGNKHPSCSRILTCYWSEARMCQRRRHSWNGTLMRVKTLRHTGDWIDELKRLTFFTGYAFAFL